MAKIKIQQIKSRIKCPAVQKRTLDALGLHKMNHSNKAIGFGYCYFRI